MRYLKKIYFLELGTKNSSNKLRNVILFILTPKKDSKEKKFKEKIYSNIRIGRNMFGNSFKEKIKEFVSVRLTFIYLIYIIMVSFVKN